MFAEHLKNEEKDAAIKLILELIAEKKPVREIYEKWIIPAIVHWECPFEAEPYCIWREHVLSTTLKTAIELCYPLVMAEYEKRKSKNKSVFVFCPWEEFHEIGIRLIADVFHAHGYAVTYTGVNTPEKALTEALSRHTPNCLAISVTNPYHLFQVQNLIRRIRIIEPNVKIMVGGQAIQRNTPVCNAIGADVYIYSIEDLYQLLENGEAK